MSACYRKAEMRHPNGKCFAVEMTEFRNQFGEIRFEVIIHGVNGVWTKERFFQFKNLILAMDKYESVKADQAEKYFRLEYEYTSRDEIRGPFQEIYNE